MLTLIGFLLGSSLVALGIIRGKAPVEIFINLEGLAIVAGGTIASTFVSYPIKQVLLAFRSYFIIFLSGTHDYIRAVNNMVQAMRVFQREGVDALQREVAPHKDLWILQDGVQMMASGYGKEECQVVLEDQIRWKMSREMKQHHLFGTMAKIAPAFGMIGTLIGLINMLITLQDNPGQVGIGLAIALTTTFYGLLLANLVFSPVSEKIRERADDNLLIETMQLECVAMLYENRNYIYVRDKLSAYLNAGSRVKIAKHGSNGKLHKRKKDVPEQVK